jgi:hypothetical protein
VTYSLETVNCDGSTAELVTATKCSIPISVLIATPFSLDWGSNVYAKVIGYNIYGDSAMSQPGYEAIILTVPDSPISLTEVTALRTSTSITFTWSKGAENGGASVIDYRVSFD